MKLYIKEFYKENTFLGLKNGTLLQQHRGTAFFGTDTTLFKLLFKNNQWSIEIIKWEFTLPINSLSDLKENNCQIKDNLLVIRIGYNFWKYKIYEAIS